MRNKKLYGVLGFLLGVLFIMPSNTYAKADFDSLLTDGNLVINGIKPTSESEAIFILDEYFYNLANTTGNKSYEDYAIYSSSCNDDYTKCNLVYHGWQPDEEKIEVNIVYNYDKDIKKIVDGLINNLGGKKVYELTDMELVNYFLYSDDVASLQNYSQKLRKAIGYKNFHFYLDVRGGDLRPFYDENIGAFKLVYNGAIYYVRDGMGVEAKHIIYVDDDTEDVKSAIEKRISDTFGDIGIEVKDGLTVSEYLESEKNEAMNNYENVASWAQSELNIYTKEEYAEYYMNTNYYNEDAYYHFLVDDKILDKYYTLNIGDKSLSVVVIKDSSKINNNISFATEDAKSGVQINTSNALIPLDTLISVARLTDGDSYDKIIKLLNVTNSETFDLKLFSNSLDKNITKLDNGTFEVRIPIKEELKDKDLVVYYVSDDNKVVEYDVKVEDGYAVFNTDHFSIYTLAEKNTISNPQTLDSVGTYIVLGVLSLLGLFIPLLKKRKEC